jgi:hypothetical protein
MSLLDKDCERQAIEFPEEMWQTFQEPNMAGI